MSSSTEGVLGGIGGGGSNDIGGGTSGASLPGGLQSTAIKIMLNKYNNLRFKNDKNLKITVKKMLKGKIEYKGSL